MLVTSEPEREIADQMATLRQVWLDAERCGDTDRAVACRRHIDRLLDLWLELSVSLRAQFPACPRAR